MSHVMKRDEGSVMLLGIILVTICILALAIVVDVSSLFLQRRNLAAIADASALAGAQAIDLNAYYERGASEATALDAAIVARVSCYLGAVIRAPAIEIKY